jgi:Flp pilus assembly protein TadD
MSGDNHMFDEYMALAKKALKNGDYNLAETEIKKAMNENPHSPEVHNLYGILEELLKEDDLAHKHYRAAYVLDPTYRPAIKNLERISTYEEHARKASIDFGDEPEAEEENLYIIEYDKNHVGHLRKKDRK